MERIVTAFFEIFLTFLFKVGEVTEFIAMKFGNILYHNDEIASENEKKTYGYGILIMFWIIMFTIVV